MKTVRFKLTPAMLPYLYQQRTQFAGHDATRSAVEYQEDMEGIMDNIVHFLPIEAKSVLDIGGGLGGAALICSRHYGAGTRVKVLEKDGDSGRKVGWHDSAAEFGAYNSLQLTREFLSINGCNNFDIYEVGDKGGFPAGPHDVVISLLSMGFHYPVKTYLQAIYESLRPGGVLVLDIRHKTREHELCHAIFGNITVLGLGKKHTLYGFQK